ncbi:MAG: NAD-dependent epimerase/dehydratase family protein [Actinomycetota bacterium]
MTRSRARRGDVTASTPAVLGTPPPARPLTVAVIGAAGPLGDQIVRTLGADPAFAGVIAIDSTATPARRRAALPIELTPEASVRVAWRTADVRHPSFARALDGVDVVVHAGVEQDPSAAAAPRRARNLDGVRTLLEAVAIAGVRRVVVLSSAMVYGAFADNPALIDENYELRAAADDSIVGDFLQIERLLADFASSHKDISVVVLRPTTIVGPGCDGVLIRHFETSRLLAIRGVTARWQFVHVADVAGACLLAVTAVIDGIVNVAPPATLTQGDLETITGSRRVELPASVVFGAADRLHRAGVTMAPAGEVAYLAYPWVVDSGRLLEAGWRPAYDSAAALRAHLVVARSPEGARRIGSNDATRAAAGATVALLGTAALLRRARRRRA